MYQFQVVVVATIILCGAALATGKNFWLFGNLGVEHFHENSNGYFGPADDERGCGGLLQGEYGRFQYPAGQTKRACAGSSCLWTIQLPSGSDIKFTLDTLSSNNSQLVLYPEQNPTPSGISSIT